MYDELLLLFIVSVAGGALSAHLIIRISRRERELGRFSGTTGAWWKFLAHDIARLVSRRIARRQATAADSSRSQKDDTRLAEAGLDTVEARERFYLARELMLAGSLVCGFMVLQRYEPLTAAPLIIAAAALSFFGPRWWIMAARTARQRRLEQELPFVLHLLAIGGETGKEPLRILDQLADTLSRTSGDHPLVVELQRAQWCARMGGTWREGLEAARRHVGNKEVARFLESLGTALEAEGARHELICSVAHEAHRCWIVRLEQQATGLAVGVLLTLGATLVGFCCLLRLPFLIG